MSDTTDTPAFPEPEAPPPHARSNYAFFSSEGGFFIGGMAFLSAETVLPTVVSELGGPDSLIAFLPVMMMIGFTLPPLFTAHIVERLPRLKPFCLVAGLGQRSVFLITGVLLYLLGRDHPYLAAWLVGLTPLVSGFFGGISGAAFMTLFSRVVPQKRHASAFAIRNIIGTLLGFGAGYAVDAILSWQANTTGYAMLHFCTFGMMMISYALFASIRETDTPEIENTSRKSLGENLRQLPDLIRADRRLRCFILLRLAGSFLFTLVPFMVIHARQVTGQEQAFIGTLVSAQMLGGVVGNLLSGWMGDRYGGLTILVLARVVTVPLALIMLFNTSEFGFLVAFFLLGMAFFANMVGGITTSVAIATKERMATYLSLVGMIGFIGLMLAGGLGALIRALSDSIVPLACAALGSVLLSIPLLRAIHHENQKRQKP